MMLQFYSLCLTVSEFYISKTCCSGVSYEALLRVPKKFFPIWIGIIYTFKKPILIYYEI